MNVVATMAQQMRAVKDEEARLEQRQRKERELHLACADHLHRALQEIENSGVKLEDGSRPRFKRDENMNEFQFSLTFEPEVRITYKTSDGRYLVNDSGRGHCHTQTFSDALEFFISDVILRLDLGYIPEEK